MKSLIGVDVGTQSVRACVYNLNGVLLAKEVIKINSTKFPKATYAEQDPLEWWDTSLIALRNVVNNPKVDPKYVVGLSYACTSCTAVFLDKDDVPVRPAILWMDRRAVGEAQLIQATNSPSLVDGGGKVSPEWMLPKILWVKNHEPLVYENSVHIVEQIDFFTRKLTGEWTLGYNHLVAKWNYSKKLGGWPDNFLASIGLEDVKEKWPTRILPLGKKAGSLSKEVAEEVGLSESVIVVQGGMDSTAGMLGLGAFNVGEIGISHGTSTVLQCQSDKFIEGIQARPDALVDEMYLIGGGEASTGSVAQWFVNQLSRDSKIPYENYYDYVDKKVKDIPAGSNGLLVLEHFQGSRIFHDPNTRGMISGLTLWHSSEHIMRAIYEGISYGIRKFLGKLQDSGYEITRVSVGGGLGVSQVCNQILADVCGHMIHRVNDNQHTALGAAIIAGVGSGEFFGFDIGVAKMVRFESVVVPNMSNKKIYDFYFNNYCRSYDAIKNIMHDVVKFENEKENLTDEQDF